MDNPFAKYFSGQSPLSTANYEPKDAEDYLSAGEVLGRPSAKNTAQRGMSQSQQMRDAYNALMNGMMKGTLIKRETYQKSPTEEYRKYLQREREEDQITGFDRFSMRVSTGKNVAQEKMERQSNLAHIWQELGSTPLQELIKRYPKELQLGGGGGGFSSSGAGAGITQPEQTSTSNIAPYGAKPTTLLQSSQGFVSKYGRIPTEQESRAFARGEYAQSYQHK